jgi:hypothetical protein
MTMTRNTPLPLPPDLSRRIMQQMATYPPGQGRTSAEIAAQMVGMDAQSMDGYLKALAGQHLVLSSECPPTRKSLWRLG